MRRFLSCLGLAKKRSWLWVWLTVIGILVAVLPLWQVGAQAMLRSPMLAIAPLLPGALLLGLLQWLFLARRFGPKKTWPWVPLTLVGVILGTLIALTFSFVLLLILHSIEIPWYGAVAVSVSSLQAIVLINLFSRANLSGARPPEPSR